MEQPDSPTSPTGRGIQSIEIGGRLLRALADAGQPMMLRDLADTAGIPPGQAHAYLVSFRKLELVEQDAASGRYRLGPFALHLGLARLRASDAYQAAAENAVNLAERLDLAVAVCVWGTHGPTVVRIHESSRQIHVNVRPGTVFGLTTTATGKLFAAFLPERMVLPRLEAELKDPARGSRPGLEDATLPALKAELAEIRRTGLSSIQDRPIPGISAMAAPVFDHSGQMQAAIMMMGPTAVVDCRLESDQARTLLAVARGISERLGHAPAGSEEPEPTAGRRRKASAAQMER